MTNVPITYIYSENPGLRDACKTNNKQLIELGAGTFIF